MIKLTKKSFFLDDWVGFILASAASHINTFTLTPHFERVSIYKNISSNIQKVNTLHDLWVVCAVVPHLYILCMSINGRNWYIVMYIRDCVITRVCRWFFLFSAFFIFHFLAIYLWIIIMQIYSHVVVK